MFRCFVAPQKICFYACLMFFSTLAFSAQKWVLLNRLDASVGKTPILRSDVHLFLKTRSLRTQLDPMFQFHPIAQKLSPSRHEIIQYLIEELLIVSRFPASEAETQKEIQSILKKNHVSKQTFQTMLSQQGFSFALYKRLIQNGISKRKLIEQEIRPNIHISEGQIKTYYLQHQAPKGTVRQVHLQILSVQINNYDSIGHARQQIQTAYQKIQKGEPFASIAQAYSDDPSSEQGGDLGFLLESDLAKPLQKAVRSLKIGSISPILKGNGRYFFIRLKEIKLANETLYQKARPKIERFLLMRAFQQAIRTWIQKTRSEVSIYEAKP